MEVSVRDGSMSGKRRSAGLFSVQRCQCTQDLMMLLVYLACELEAAGRYNIDKKKKKVIVEIVSFYRELPYNEFN